MKALFLNYSSSSLPKYKKLAAALRSAICDGRVKPGERLPSTREMGKSLGMHRHTVMNALAELEAEGWVHSIAKKYYEVSQTLPSTFLQPKKIQSSRVEALTMPYRFAKTIRIAPYEDTAQYPYGFPSGFPDLHLFPRKEFKSLIHDSLKNVKNLGYGNPVGHEKLREEISTYLRRIRNVKNREIVITNGSQEALFLLGQLFLSKDDAVAVEEIGYPPAVEALRFSGAKVVPVAVDRFGIIPERLELVLKKNPIKILYLTPLHQYPTTVTLTASRRLQIYEIACKYGALLIEDDYDHEFHYSSQPIAPLASFDLAKIVLYVSTFSKILFPSARLGFMAVPKEIAEEIAKMKKICSRQNEQILQDAIARWMFSGGFEAHLRKMRKTYEGRRNAMAESLLKYQKSNREISFEIPDGGMGLWLNLGKDTTKLALKAKSYGLLLNPEAGFRLDRSTGTHLRMGFSGKTEKENDAALKLLFSIL